MKRLHQGLVLGCPLKKVNLVRLQVETSTKTQEERLKSSKRSLKQQPRNWVIHLEAPYLHLHQRIPAKLDRLLHLLHRFGRYLGVVKPTSQKAGVATWESSGVHDHLPLLVPCLAEASYEVLQCFCLVPMPHIPWNWLHAHSHQTKAQSAVTPKDWKNDQVEDSAHKHHPWIRNNCWVRDFRCAAISTAFRTPPAAGCRGNPRRRPLVPLVAAGHGCLLGCRCLANQPNLCPQLWCQWFGYQFETINLFWILYYFWIKTILGSSSPVMATPNLFEPLEWTNLAHCTMIWGRLCPRPRVSKRTSGTNTLSSRVDPTVLRERTTSTKTHRKKSFESDPFFPTCFKSTYIRSQHFSRQTGHIFGKQQQPTPFLKQKNKNNSNRWCFQRWPQPAPRYSARARTAATPPAPAECRSRPRQPGGRAESRRQGERHSNRPGKKTQIAALLRHFFKTLTLIINNM